MSDETSALHGETPDFQAAQDQLAKTLDRAQAGEDKALATQVREKGETLAKMLNSTLRLTKLHDSKNDAFNTPIAELERIIVELLDLLGAVHMVMVGGQVYVNDIRVRFEPTDETGQRLVMALRPHAIGGISLHQAPKDAELRLFIHRSGSEPPAEGHPRARFQQFLGENGMEYIELSPVFRFRAYGEGGAGEGSGTQDFQAVYNRSTTLVADAWKNLCAKRLANPLPMRRLVTSLIDSTRDDDNQKLLTASQGEESAFHVQHTLNVATMAVVLGRELNLPNASLADLGVAALFHDVGYTAGDAGRTVSFGAHSIQGTRVLLRQRGFHEAKIRRLLVNLQHHWRYDHTPKPTLFARIIHIADDYDTFTRTRPDGPLMTPSDALARMVGGAGTQYDPVLMQMLVNRLGKYPAGTLLELEDGRWAMSCSGVRSPETFDTPLCVVTKLADGTEPEESTLVDLAEEGRVARVIGIGG
jgi:hypothetical protein